MTITRFSQRTKIVHILFQRRRGAHERYVKGQGRVHVSMHAYKVAGVLERSHYFCIALDKRRCQ